MARIVGNTEQNIKAMSMGTWKSATSGFRPDGKKHVHTSSGIGKRRERHPPEGGWPGGDPEKNGWKPGGGKR